MKPTAASVILGTLLLACGGGSGDDADDGAPPDAPSTPAAFDDGIAQVEVRGQTFGGSAGGDTSMTAMLVTAPAPWPYEPAVVDGVCRMWVRRAANTCVPQCGFDQICDGGTCVDWPVSASAGTLRIAGNGEDESIAYTDGYYRYVQRVLFPAGTEVTASAPGAAGFAGFSLAARMPSPLELVGTEELVLAIGTPLRLRWTPADADARVRVVLGADLGHGRHRSVVVECDVADGDAGVTIPQAMVDELADPENWSCGDCFGHDLRRYRRGDTTAGATSLTLWAVAPQSLYLRP